MLCPYCTQETKVLESRHIDTSVRRRRECLDCNNRFTTYEKPIFHLTVKKKNGKEQPFNANKITESLKRACSKAQEQEISELSKKIETKLLSTKKGVFTTVQIGKTVLKELKKFDKIAYVRYASIHKDIEDPKMLVSMISN
jgi:transcriptional repressor NrdR